VSLLRADLAPLRASREFRLLSASRTVTLFGTLAADVALLVQAKQLTGSTFEVGLLGAVELVPLVIFGLYGGVLADRLDRGRLLAAGAADMLSGIFRDTLWNQTIPDALRGRLAGVEVLSYSIGPSAGQIRAGAVAAVTTTRVSLWSGGGGVRVRGGRGLPGATRLPHLQRPARGP